MPAMPGQSWRTPPHPCLTPGMQLRWSRPRSGGPQPPREAPSSGRVCLWENKGPAPHKGVMMSVKEEAARLQEFILMPLIRFQHN